MAQQKPTRQGTVGWPLTEQGLANLNDDIDNLYRRLRTAQDSIVPATVMVCGEVPSGAIPGADFTTAFDFEDGTLAVYIGLRQDATDFTVTGTNTFTLTAALEAGDTILVDYVRVSGTTSIVGPPGPAGADGTTPVVNLSAATVATSEVQASNTTYGDLATSGPAVTLTLIGTMAIIWLSCDVTHGAVGNSGFISVAVSGASTVAASNTNSAVVSSAGVAYDNTLSRVLVLTGLTPGVNTFTMKYQNNGGGTWTFQFRSIAVYAP